MSDDKEVVSSELGELERRLLRSAELLDVPSDEAKARARNLMTLAAGTAVAASVVRHAGLAKWKLWLLGSFGAVAVVGGLRHAVSLRAHPAHPEGTVNAVPVVPVAQPAAAATVGPPSPPEEKTSIETAPALPVRSSSSVLSRTPATVAPSPSATLPEQIRMLDRAHDLTEGGGAAQALSVLDDYDRRFPNGALAQEAAVARIEALSKLGRITEATSLANRFLAAHPASSHADHLRKVVRAAGAPSAGE
jgi:hypothetical protein